MSLITTSETDCRDCYRCVRTCPVKAIQIKDGRAQIREEMCINDGQCVLTCPQKAKEIKPGRPRVQNWRDRGFKLIASLAPSFVAAFPNYSPEQITGAIKKLGFSSVQETAIGAEIIAPLHWDLVKGSKPLPLISSACPVVVRLVERYYADYVDHLTPLVSPLIAHGRKIKAENKDPGLKVIFIGPCAAKKQEINEPEIKDAVDEGLTFEELREWWEEEGIDPSQEKGTLNENTRSPGWARSFPVDGGLFKAALLESDFVREDIFSVSGLDEIVELFDDFPSGENIKLIEAMACRGGCITGPGMPESCLGTLQGRNKVASYCSVGGNESYEKQEVKELSLQSEFSGKNQLLKAPSEEVIKEFLSRIGKKGKQDELNCGACGYNSCREKAIAVYHGLAELEMCMPYMRARAESFAEAIIQNSPNGIIVVDYQLKIQSINAQAEKMFNFPAEEVKGMSLKLLLPASTYQKALEKKKIIVQDGYYPEQDLYTHENIFPLPEQEIIVGIYNDVTTDRKQKEKLSELKRQTLEKTEEVINKQMRTVQEIAGLLGETTAETKSSLGKMAEIFELEE